MQAGLKVDRVDENYERRPRPEGRWPGKQQDRERKKTQMSNSSYPRRSGRRPRFLTGICLAAAISMAASACGADSAAESNGEESGDFILYASLGMSGADSAFAPSIKAGLEAAIGEINDNGGLLGREVKLEEDNNESNPTKAVSLLQDRIREGRPDLIWAGTASSESLAMQGLTTREKIMALNNGSAAELGDASTFPYAFSAGVQFSTVAEFLADYIAEQGHQKVGVLTGEDPAGEAAAGLYKNTLESAGLTVVSESYESESVEVDGPLVRLAGENPDLVLFNSTFGPEPILKSRVKVGMADVPFLGDTSTTIRSMAETLSDKEKTDVELTTFTVNTTAADNPGVTNLTESLDEAGVDYSTSLFMYALAYDPILAYANAVESVGSTDVEKVRAAMEAGEGDTYSLSLGDNPGWTETTHLASGEGRFATIPIVPLESGQFQVAND